MTIASVAAKQAHMSPAWVELDVGITGWQHSPRLKRYLVTVAGDVLQKLVTLLKRRHTIVTFKLLRRLARLGYIVCRSGRWSNIVGATWYDYGTSIRLLPKNITNCRT